MFATFAPWILWFAQRNLWLAPPNAGFAMEIFSKTHQSSLTLKGGSTSHLGLLPSGKKSCCGIFSNPSVSLSKGSSTSLSKPLPSQKGEDVPTALLGAQTASL